MATTTNYAWTTPDDTDLVKNGALAIRTLGSAIDATAFSTFIGQKLISTTTLSGSSISLSSIPQTYRNLRLVFRSVTTSAGVALRLRINGDATANRHNGGRNYSTAPGGANTFTDTSILGTGTNHATAGTGLSHVWIPDYTNTTTWKFANVMSISSDATTTFYSQFSVGAYNQTGAITSIDIFPTSGTMGGTVLLYGEQ